MNPVWIIQKKRDGGELSRDEIATFIAGFARDEIPDYQMAALAMAIYLNGMTPAEIAGLTDEMLASGIVFQWPDDGGVRVDKHSTGGIGDKVSLPLAAMLACCDLQVPMISGRGLGATGGTLDKLESIPGFRTDLSVEEFRRITMEVGCVIASASDDLAPADRKLYALRDVTATVPSIPLITASIMSKKLAEGLDALVLDVKVGSGAFMKTRDDARALAHSLVATGERMNVETRALITDMNQPLGRAVGNAVEVDESLTLLEGGGPDDLREVTLALGSELLVMTGRAETPAAAQLQLAKTIDDGTARERFAKMTAAQGGDIEAARKIAPARSIASEAAGTVTSIDAERIGQAVIAMGGGRKQKGDAIDHSTGLEMQVRLGDQIEPGQPLATLFAPAAVADEAAAMLREAITLGEDPVESPRLIERL